MGYDLHITRRKDWSDEGNDITAQEWLDYIEKDPELSLFGQNGPYFAVWNTAESSEEYWLDWFEGAIYSKNPNQSLIDKMVIIATHFNAIVQGDEGEVYGEGRRSVDNHQRKSAVDKKESWLKKILGRK